VKPERSPAIAAAPPRAIVNGAALTTGIGNGT
jgi:hypothetical protein